MSFTLTDIILDQIQINPNSEKKLESLEMDLMFRITLNSVTKRKYVEEMSGFLQQNPLDSESCDSNKGTNYITEIWYDGLIESRDEHRMEKKKRKRDAPTFVPTNQKQMKIENYFEK